MRVAALYDIHANLPALEAVLEDAEREGVDKIIFGGDLAWGPFPLETMDVLLGLDGVEFVRGNADREVGERLGAEDGLDPQVAEVNQWCADRLSGEMRQWLAGLPAQLTLEVDGLGPVFLCHGSPRSDEEQLTHLTPEARMRQALTRVNESLVVCGHTHMQFDRRVDASRVVNAGSVGLPYQRPAGAYWALLGPEVELRRTDYDVGSAIEAMRLTDCPHVEEFFIDPLLHTPDADETARRFES